MVFLAQADGATPSGGGMRGGDLIFMFAIIAVAFYLLILRPQKKQAAQREQLLNTVGKGTKVISAGGIHGTVVDPSPSKDTVLLEIAKGTRITINRSAISVVNPEEKKKEEKEEKKDEKKGGEK